MCMQVNQCYQWPLMGGTGELSVVNIKSFWRVCVRKY